MKCYACGSEKVTPELGECPVCGFRVLYSVPQEGEEERETENRFRELGRQYRKKQLEGIQVGLVTYSYALEEDRIQKSRETKMILADLGEMELGQVRWSGEDFARLEADSVNLDVFFRKKDEDRFFVIKAVPPKAAGFWHVGVVLNEEFRVSLVLESGGEETRIESIAVL